MVLADASIWIQHLQQGEAVLMDRLSEGLVLMHPFVSGELACGNLRHRSEILSDLQALPQAGLASDDEVLRLIEDQRLWGRGLGWVDLDLVASSLLADCAFWTLDRRLALAAKELGLGCST